MIAPCEYCARPVTDAERFFRLGVLPCCGECRWIAGVAGMVGIAALCAALIAGLWRF